MRRAAAPPHQCNAGSESAAIFAFAQHFFFSASGKSTRAKRAMTRYRWEPEDEDAEMDEPPLTWPNSLAPPSRREIDQRLAEMDEREREEERARVLADEAERLYASQHAMRVPPSVAEIAEAAARAPLPTGGGGALGRCWDKVCAGGVLSPGDRPDDLERRSWGDWHRERWSQVERCDARNQWWRRLTNH